MAFMGNFIAHTCFIADMAAQGAGGNMLVNNTPTLCSTLALMALATGSLGGVYQHWCRNKAGGRPFRRVVAYPEGGGMTRAHFDYAARIPGVRQR
jgi:hypothetical protein